MIKNELLTWSVTDLTVSINIQHSYNEYTCVIYRHVSHVGIRLRTIETSTRTRRTIRTELSDQNRLTDKLYRIFDTRNAAKITLSSLSYPNIVNSRILLPSLFSSLMTRLPRLAFDISHDHKNVRIGNLCDTIYFNRGKSLILT